MLAALRIPAEAGLAVDLHIIFLGPGRRMAEQCADQSGVSCHP